MPSCSHFFIVAAPTQTLFFEDRKITTQRGLGDTKLSGEVRGVDLALVPESDEDDGHALTAQGTVSGARGHRCSASALTYRQVQRCCSGTWTMTSSMCSPQPDQVTLLQREHVAGLHMSVSSPGRGCNLLHNTCREGGICGIIRGW